MAKVWSLPPCFLPTTLLMREHESLHKLLTIITEPGKLSSRSPYFTFGGYLIWRHYLDVCEMLKRGYRHESFVDGFWKALPQHRRRLDYRVHPSTEHRDARDLAEKIRLAATMAGQDAPSRIDEFKPGALSEKLAGILATGLPPNALLY